MDERKIMEDAVQTMSRYVQFDTTNPPGNEMPAALWMRDQLTARGITSDIRIHEPVAGRGLVAARIAGTEALKILLGRGPVRGAPHGFQVDAYSNRTLHTWRPGGNRNPLNQIAIALAKRIMRKSDAAGGKP